MKNRIKRWLEKRGIYEYLKYSRLFYLYERLYKPEVKKEFERELKFYRSFLPQGSLIFDIGAYDGHKTAVLLQLADKVVCCEPDQQNFRTLKIRFRNRMKRVFIENAALASTPDVREMFVHHSGSAFNTLNEKFKKVTEADDCEKWNEKIVFENKTTVQTTTLDALIRKYGVPFFIKIDVEGYELEVLRGLSQPISYLSLECLLPDFAGELENSIEILKRLDSNLQFNISVYEKLFFEEFQPLSFMQHYLKNFRETHFELIVKMQT